eukprot:13893.XXX_344533_343793_1 [CDS] Oithona nana genome sequencing.
MEELITCPYNKFHQIRPTRIQYHLIKCKKRYPNADMIICPFNASHHVPREEERTHLLECRDKRMIEVQKYNEPLPGHHGYLNNPTVYGSSLISMEEELAESMSRVDLLRLDDSVSTVSNFERSIANRSRVDLPRRRGPVLSRKSSSERPPPVVKRPMTSTAARSSHGLHRSPSPAIEGSNPRRTSPSPLRFVGDVSLNNSSCPSGNRSYAQSYGTSYKSYKSSK